MVDKKICIQCIENTGVKKKIQQSQHRAVCSYCGAAEWVESFEVIVKYIEECILYDYDQAAPQAPRGTYSIKDVLDDKNFQASIQVHTDIAQALMKKSYSAKSEVNVQESPEKTHTLIQRWDAFKQLIQTQNRFFCKDHRVSFNKWGKTYNPATILLEIVEAIQEHAFLLLELNEENALYRARSQFKSKSYDARSLGHPPFGKASATRMTPVGIPAFYASLDPQLAVEEIKTTASKFIVGKWQLDRPIRVVNLSGAVDKEVPDFFDYERKDERNIVLFLPKFSAEVSKPVVKDGREHIEYVPTQALAEFIKTSLNDVHGIAYVSDVAPKQSGTTIKEVLNVALFVEKFNFVDGRNNNKVDDGANSATTVNTGRVTCRLKGFKEVLV